MSGSYYHGSAEYIYFVLVGVGYFTVVSNILNKHKEKGYEVKNFY